MAKKESPDNPKLLEGGYQPKEHVLGDVQVKIEKGYQPQIPESAQPLNPPSGGSNVTPSPTNQSDDKKK